MYEKLIKFYFFILKYGVLLYFFLEYKIKFNFYFYVTQAILRHFQTFN